MRFIMIFAARLLVYYLAAAFIAADWYWFDGVMTTWPAVSRAMLLWNVLVCAMVAGFAYWFLKRIASK